MASDLGLAFDWQNHQSHLLLNLRLPKGELSFLQELYASMPVFPAHIWLATSGTSSQGGRARKLVAISKAALLHSAQAVNQVLQSHRKDVWISVLPRFHVGGIGIQARAFLAESRICDGLEGGRWNPSHFVSVATEERATLSALVPAQVFDLVAGGLRAPASLRAIVVGGGALAPSLYWQARQLGWSLLPSYGMTECGSQVATANLQSLNSVASRESAGEGPSLLVLPHLRLRHGLNENIQIRGSSLLTGYALEQAGRQLFWDPKDQEGWFTSEDRGEVVGDVLRVWGRDQDFVKVLGENINLAHLEALAQRSAQSLGLTTDLAIGVAQDDRAGASLWLCLPESQIPEHGDRLLAMVNEAVAPYERLQGHSALPAHVRNSMGKLNRAALSNWLNQVGPIGSR